MTNDGLGSESILQTKIVQLSVAVRARDHERGLHTLHAEPLLVQAHWQAGEIDEAGSVLERGLSLAAERGIVQPFVDESPELARILYRALSMGVDNPFIGKLLAAFPHSGGRDAVALLLAPERPRGEGADPAFSGFTCRFGQ